MTNSGNRLIIVEQRQPRYLLQPETTPPTLVALKWELIDRGPNFTCWDSKSVKETVIGRYATYDEAADVLDLIHSS